MIRPSIAADRRRMAAVMVRTVDQETANAGRSHFPEGDFLLACRRGWFGHGPLKRESLPPASPQDSFSRAGQYRTACRAKTHRRASLSHGGRDRARAISQIRQISVASCDDDARSYMSTKIDAFISEIRARPEFVAAAALDPKKSDDLDTIEYGLNVIDRWADDDPATVDIFDKIQNVIGRGDLSIKQRLLEMGELLTQFRDAG